jgi:lipopolysaccharide export system protein LptA
MGVTVLMLICALAAPDTSQPYLISANTMKVQSLPADRITWLYGQVELTHGTTVLRGDSAWASSTTGQALIWGHFRLTDRTAVVTGARARYDKAAGRAVVWGAPRASDNEWTMTADSIIYLKDLARSYAAGHVALADTSGRNRATGAFGEYWHGQDYGRLTGRPRFEMKSADSAKPPATIDADTMEIEQRGARAVGTGNVVYAGDSVWAGAGRLAYDRQRNRIELERQPRIWDLHSQVSAGRIDLELEGNAFRTAWAGDSAVLRQASVAAGDTDLITGDSLRAEFEQRVIVRAAVTGNAWSRYHQLDKGAAAGRNLAAGDRMDFGFSNGKIARITIRGGARGAYLELPRGKGTP